MSASGVWDDGPTRPVNYRSSANEPWDFPRAIAYRVEIIYIFELFRRTRATKQFCCATKPFSAFGADVRKRRVVITSTTRTAGCAGGDTGDRQMRTLSFFLAFAFLVAGPTMAGLSDSSLPGAGTFTYNGPPIVTSAPAIIVAVR